jgi:hypothetical protein
MSLPFQIVPTYEQPIQSGKNTSAVWYRFFQGVFLGTPPSSEITITAGASPYTYTAPAKGFLIVRGGTVSAIQFTRTVTTLTGQTAGLFPLSQGDQLTVTYSGLPTLVWVPQ